VASECVRLGVSKGSMRACKEMTVLLIEVFVHAVFPCHRRFASVDIES
jgi:hypothetical protein